MRHSVWCHIVRFRKGRLSTLLGFVAHSKPARDAQMKDRHLTEITRIELEKDDDDAAFKLVAFVLETDDLLQLHIVSLLEYFIHLLWMDAIKQRLEQGDDLWFSSPERVAKRYHFSPFVKFLLKVVKGEANHDAIHAGLLGLVRCVSKNVRDHWPRFKRMACVKALAS